MIAQVVLGVLVGFVASAVRSGLALAGSIGVLLIGLGAYTTLPTSGFGWALFGVSAFLFVLAGGMKGR